MTLDLDAIREMVEVWGEKAPIAASVSEVRQAWRDRRPLLAKVDRLRALITHYGEGAPSLPGALIAAHERARTRAAVEALPVPGRLSMRGADDARVVDRAAVRAAIDGERR